MVCFEAIVNVFLISFSVYLLLDYKKAAGFCILILDPSILLKVFSRFKCFLVESLGSLMYTIIILSTSKDT